MPSTTQDTTRQGEAGDPTATLRAAPGPRAAQASTVTPGRVQTLRRQHLPDGLAGEPAKDMRTLLRGEVAAEPHANTERDTDQLTVRGRGPKGE